MQSLGFVKKLILFAIVLMLALAQEKGTSLDYNGKIESNKPKQKSKKTSKKKSKRPKSDLEYLQEYQQKHGSNLINVNEVLINIPQIQQYSLVRDIYPAKLFQKTNDIENIINQLNRQKREFLHERYYQQPSKITEIKFNEVLINIPEIQQYSVVGVVYPPKLFQKTKDIDTIVNKLQKQKSELLNQRYYKQSSKITEIKAKQVFTNIPQIQQYSIVRQIYPLKIFQKRRETQNIVKQLKQKWTLEDNRQILESNQKLAKLSNQIIKYIDNEHQNKQNLNNDKKNDVKHVQAKPLQDYQRPNKQQDKKKNDLIQEIKKQLMQKQLLRKQKEKEEQRKRKQAQQIRKFDQQKKQQQRKKAENEEKMKQQRQKQEAAKLEQAQRKKKIEQQKTRKQIQMQMNSMAKSFDSMLLTNPKMQDLLRKRIQAEHLEEQAMKREEARKANLKAKTTQSQNIVQNIKKTDAKDVNQNVQAKRQPIQIVNSAISNPQHAKQLQINKNQAVQSEQFKIEDLQKSKANAQIYHQQQSQQNKSLQTAGDKDTKEISTEKINQQSNIKINDQALQKDNNDVSIKQQKQQTRNQTNFSLPINDQSYNVEQVNNKIVEQSKTVEQSNNSNIISINSQQNQTISNNNNAKKQNQDIVATVKQQNASSIQSVTKRQVPIQQSKSLIKKPSQVAGSSNNETHDIPTLKQKKQNQIPAIAKKQTTKSKDKWKKKKQRNIKDIFGAASKAQIRQQLIKRIKEYEQSKQAKADKKVQLQTSIQSNRPNQKVTKNSMFGQQKPKQITKNDLNQQGNKKIKHSQKDQSVPQLRLQTHQQQDTDENLFKQLKYRIQNNKKSRQKQIRPNNLRPQSPRKSTPFIQYVIYFIFVLFILLAICSKLNSFNHVSGPHSIAKSVKSSRGSLIPEQELEI